MKKLLLVLMLVSSSAFGVNGDSIRTTVKCIEGYKFLFTWSSNTAGGISVVQIMERTNSTIIPQPMRCSK